MKTSTTLVLALVSFASMALHAQVGPPRKPGDPDDPRRPGGKKSAPAKPTAKPGPSAPPPKSVPKVGPTPRPGPGPGPTPTVRKVGPGAPTPGVPRSVVRPGVPEVRRAVPGSPSVVIRKPGVVNPPGPAGGPGAGIRFDLGRVRGALSLAPRRVAPPPVVVRPGGPTRFLRVYDRTRNVVIVPSEDGGQSTEMPYIAVPILFAPGTADLLDQTAADDMQALASALLEIYAQDKGVRFVIEGHTSTDGSEAENLQLSIQRASHVYAELISRYGLPADVLSIKGYGEAYADYPNGSEEQMQLDRRVLVVRTK